MLNMEITSANATAILIVEDLYPAGIVLQGFTSDQSVSTDDRTVAEARMGVDGHLAAGYTPTPVTVTIGLEANSPSRAQLANVLEAMQLNMRTYTCALQFTIPSIKKEFYYTNGVMLAGHPAPDGRKVLDPTQWRFVFESQKSQNL